MSLWLHWRKTWIRWQGSLLRNLRQEAWWPQWGWVTTLLHWMPTKCSCSYDKVEHVHESRLKKERHRRFYVQMPRHSPWMVLVSYILRASWVCRRHVVHEQCNIRGINIGASLYILTLRKHVDDIKSKFSDSSDTKLIVNRRYILVSCHLSSN